MPIVFHPQPPELDPSLVSRLQQVSYPTIGHFLESGFVDPEIRTLTPGHTFVGRAITARIPSPDGVLLHRVVAQVQPGDVVVIDTGSDRTHAVVGAVIATAATVAGAAGIVVDGVVTDILELREMAIPVFARGTSVLTAKQIGIDDGGINVPVACGGVTVHPGDVVMADENGVLILPPAVAEEVLDKAAASDHAEPGLIAQLRAGKSLPQLSGADELLARMGYPAS
jgi:4-hydroxy-4-methyl-2-oxoglutarate aldolase